MKKSSKLMYRAIGWVVFMAVFFTNVVLAGTVNAAADNGVVYDADTCRMDFGINTDFSHSYFNKVWHEGSNAVNRANPNDGVKSNVHRSPDKTRTAANIRSAVPLDCKFDYVNEAGIIGQHFSYPNLLARCTIPNYALLQEIEELTLYSIEQ